MTPFINSKNEGKLEMSGKVNLGVPRGKIKSAPKGDTNKQDKRGEDTACIYP